MLFVNIFRLQSEAAVEIISHESKNISIIRSVPTMVYK